MQNNRIESWVTESIKNRHKSSSPVYPTIRDANKRTTFGQLSRGDAAARFNEIIKHLTKRNKTRLSFTRNEPDAPNEPVIYDNKELYACYSFDSYTFDDKMKKNATKRKLPPLPTCQIL